MTIVGTLLKNLPQILMVGVQILWELIKGIGSVIGSLAKQAGQIFTTIWDAIKGLPAKMLEMGKNLITGLANGLMDKLNWLKDKVKNLASGITNTIKNALGIHSPSRVFAQLGAFTAEGFGEGFADEMKDVTSEMQDAMPTSLDVPVTASGLPTSSSTGGFQTTALVEAFKTAMQGMRIEMGEDGFASFVVDTITNEIYQ